MNVDPEELAVHLAQEAIESIDYMTVVETLEFDHDIDDETLAQEVMEIITTRVVARAE